MKVLYAIQGTGNGHLSRARDIIPILKEKVELDILVSGSQADVGLSYPIKYKLHGLGFIFGKKGGVDIMETYKKNKLRVFLNEIKNLPVEDYDLIINDFEPVSAWACYFKRKPCVSLSHQCAVLHKNAPKPRRIDILGRIILKKYAPTQAQYGFHFKSYGPNIQTPVIRQEVRDLETRDLGHYTVYLPAYEDKRIIKFLKKFPFVEWQVFSKHSKDTYKEQNVHVFPINNEDFIKSLTTCTGVLCGAGFETPAEALFLGKKLLVVPMKNQFEQQCNAAALKDLGVPVIKSLRKKHLATVDAWLDDVNKIEVDYPNLTEKILDTILENHLYKNNSTSSLIHRTTNRKIPRIATFKKLLVQPVIG